MPTRKQIVEKAREYVGTPFHHLGRAKGVGIDCGGLFICVSHDLGVKNKSGAPITREDYKEYSRQPVGNLVNEYCQVLMHQKSIKDLKPGDVVSLKVPTEPCHVAIISEIDGYLAMIHAYDAGEHKCIEHVLSPQWRRRIVGVFSFPEVTD